MSKENLEERRFAMFLHYVDDILVASTDQRFLSAFFEQMKEKFDIEVKPRADWYLQTRIQQDKDGNLTLDQTRYAKAMITRFLPTFSSEEPSEKDKKKYAVLKDSQ